MFLLYRFRGTLNGIYDTVPQKQSAEEKRTPIKIKPKIAKLKIWI